MIEAAGAISKIAYLENNVRTCASSMGAKDAFEHALKGAKQNKDTSENKIEFHALGAPAGFFLDTSLLESR